MHAEPLEPHQHHRQMLDPGVLDSKSGARHGGETDERSDLDVIGANGVRRAMQHSAALHRQLVRSDPVDLRPERNKEMREILHMRL
jgi:hypothetical protein